MYLCGHPNRFTSFALQLTDQLNDILRSLSGFYPEVFLTGAVVVVIVADLALGYRKSEWHRPALYGLSAVGILGAGMLTVGQLSHPAGFLFGTMFFQDSQAIFFNLIVALAALVALAHAGLLLPGFPEKSHPVSSDGREALPADWLPILLTLVLGLFVMTQSVNLLAIYLSLELVSICSYLLTALTTGRKPSEAGIKYLLFGAVSSAIMLYGMSLLYGLTGTLDLTSGVVPAELAKNPPYVVFLAGFLVLTGLFFKMSLVPMHLWTPDTYEAAPTPVVSFFSVAPKAAALLVLMRVISALPVTFQTPLAVIALASITLGNLSALWQTDAKRLLAYSTIAHAGFVLTGVVAFSEAGFEAATFYMATYLFINMAAFLLMDVLGHPRGGGLALRDFEGLGLRRPLPGVALTIVMIALTGLPPTVGFTAKLLAFSALFDAVQMTGNGWLLALFGLGVLNAVVSLFYYLKIPFLMYFRGTPPPEGVVQPSASLSLPVGLMLLLLIVPILLFFFRPDWLVGWIAGL